MEGFLVGVLNDLVDLDDFLLPSSVLLLSSVAEESIGSGGNDLSFFHFLSSLSYSFVFTIFHAELLSLFDPLTRGATMLEIWLISPLLPLGILLGVGG